MGVIAASRLHAHAHGYGHGPCLRQAGNSCLCISGFHKTHVLICTFYIPYVFTQ